MRRFDSSYAALVAHGNLAVRRSDADQHSPALAPPFDDAAVVVALTIAMVRLSRGRGPNGLNWGPHRADLRSCRWKPGWLWDLHLVSPTTGELTDADMDQHRDLVPASMGRDAGEPLRCQVANDEPRTALPVALAELLIAHAECGSGACLAVLAWLKRCGLLPQQLNLGSVCLSLKPRPDHPHSADPQAQHHAVQGPELTSGPCATECAVSRDKENVHA